MFNAEDHRFPSMGNWLKKIISLVKSARHENMMSSIYLAVKKTPAYFIETFAPDYNCGSLMGHLRGESKT